MLLLTEQRGVLLTLLFLAVLAAYANHFQNSFHFDDSHTIQDNPSIRSLSNLPRFFTDTSLFSVLPANRAWRPFVSASLALDYWLGGGLNPVAFHVSTFVWYFALLTVLFFLAERVFDSARPSADHRLLALFCAALYGLHPVSAETVNYIIQRGDLYSTLGVAAGLYLFAARPQWRRFGIYLLPVVVGQLSKPPALIFPLLLILYLRVQEDRKWNVCARSVIPALLVTVAVTILQVRMTPSTYTGGSVSGWLYRITQPFVAWRYFADFFLPIRLSADTDLRPFSSLAEPAAIGGFLFVAVFALAATLCARGSRTGPIGFGMWWFLLALVPTSVYPLAEVENDHRMFLPFVGLSIALTWAAALLWERAASQVPQHRAVAIGAAGLVLAGFGYGTHVRNQAWKDEASLWRDVTIKSPRNGRGLMNYGLSLMAAGKYEVALHFFRRALEYTPNYPILEINLGILTGELRQDAEAERHFQRAIALSPGDALPQYYYARWLNARGRLQEAMPRIRKSIELNPADPNAKALFVELATQPARQAEEVAREEQAVKDKPSAAAYLNLSLRYNQAGKYQESIHAAREALKLKPDYAEAYNNIAAAHEELHQWDEAIRAAREALRIMPDFALARNNLAWSEAQKAQETRKKQGRIAN